MGNFDVYGPEPLNSTVQQGCFLNSTGDMEYIDMRKTIIDMTSCKHRYFHVYKFRGIMKMVNFACIKILYGTHKVIFNVDIFSQIFKKGEFRKYMYIAKISTFTVAHFLNSTCDIGDPPSRAPRIPFPNQNFTWSLFPGDYIPYISQTIY